jgi:hypothetical protein
MIGILSIFLSFSWLSVQGLEILTNSHDLSYVQNGINDVGEFAEPYLYSQAWNSEIKFLRNVQNKDWDLHLTSAKDSRQPTIKKLDDLMMTYQLIIPLFCQKLFD